MRFARAAKSSWLASGVSLDRGVRAEGTVATEDERSHVGDRVAGLSGTGCSTSGTATLASSGRPGFVGAGDTSLCANRAGGRGAAFCKGTACGVLSSSGAILPSPRASVNKDVSTPARPVGGVGFASTRRDGWAGGAICAPCSVAGRAGSSR